MPFHDKVIWSEGMFIRAQHFQQDRRYLEHLLEGRVGALRAYGWGLAELRLNREMLSIGRFAVERAAGVFEDGTPFAAPEDADELPPLQLGENTRNAIVCLTLPITQPGGREAAGSGVDARTRFTVRDVDVHDATSDETATASVTVGKLRLGYALETSESNGLISIGLARVVEVRADNSIVLDEGYIPPALDARTSPVLTGMLTEIVGLLNHRGEALAARLSAGSAGTAAEMTDTLMLQTINRWQPVFAHLASASVHPETMFQNMVALAGELATVTTPGRRPRPFPVYDHKRLQQTFAPVVVALRQSLSAVLDRGAIAIPLTEYRYGIRVASVPDRSVYAKYAFVLAAKANMPAETLLRRLVGQVKAGPVEQIRELVNTALPGVALHALTAAPRQIPYHTGKAYFELDRTSPMWKQIASSGGLAIHAAGDFPGLELELWAVKD